MLPSFRISSSLLMPSYSQKTLESTLEATRANPNLSTRHTAKQFSVPKSTF